MKANLGCRAIEASGGSFAKVSRDCMVMSPLVVLPSESDAIAFARYLEEPSRIDEAKRWFAECAVNYELSSMSCQRMGRRMFVRFSASCGDSPNSTTMLKGIERIFLHLKDEWKGVDIDVNSDLLEAVEQASGKSVTAEVVIPADVFESILDTPVKTVLSRYSEMQTVKAKVVQGALARNLVLSALLATGQDISQPGLAANAIHTSCEPVFSLSNDDIVAAVRITCTLPSLELSTVGGKQSSSVHKGCLDLLNVAGSNMMMPGANSQKLAEIICSAVLAAEIGGLSPRTSMQISKPAEIRDSDVGRNRNIKRSSVVDQMPVPEAARGLSTSRKVDPSERANVLSQARAKGNNAYVELVEEKCAAEFGWADPRLTVP